jgi:pimeloyl-ACP methyl ester carboxylesterase
MWSGQIDEFAGQHRVLAPDLRGFGQSSGERDVLTMAQHADDLAALLDAVGVAGPVTFCGLSMGGYVAWEFWKRHGARLSRLVLCDTRAAADSPDAAAGRRKTADKVLAEGTAEFAAGMIPKLFAESTRSQQPNIVEATLRVMHATRPQTVAAALRGMAERADFSAALSEIDVPTLVVCGEHDAITPPAEMQQVARSLPHARYVPIPSAGHMAPLENPAAVNAAMREFLP